MAVLGRGHFGKVTSIGSRNTLSVVLDPLSGNLYFGYFTEFQLCQLPILDVPLKVDVNEQFGNEAVGLGGKYTSQEGLELGREEERGAEEGFGSVGK